MLQEFKKFAMRGNVMDMAIGIILGTAFGKIVSSAVKDVIMPPIGLLLGGIDFRNLAITLEEAAVEGNTVVTEAVQIRYGAFLNLVVDFLVVAFVIFVGIKTVNRLKGAEPEPEPTEKKCPRCCSAIPIKATRCAHCTSDLKDAA